MDTRIQGGVMKQLELNIPVWLVEDSGDVLCTQIIEYHKEDPDLVIVLSRNRDGYIVLSERVFEIGDREGVKACLNGLAEKCRAKLGEIEFQIQLIDNEPEGE